MLLKIIKIIEETSDTKTFRLALNENFNFLPGQFIMAEANINNKLVRRAYSISTPPTEKKYLEITVKRIENGLMSNYLHSLKENASLEIKGPYGHFVLDEKEKHHVFIAAGCGLAPFMSMIRYVINKTLDINIALIYSEKTPEYVIFKKELDQLQKNKNFKFILTLTRVKEVSKGCSIGRISTDLIKNNANLKSLFYVSGPVNMVDSILNLLKELVIPKEKIKIEKY